MSALARAIAKSDFHPLFGFAREISQAGKRALTFPHVAATTAQK